MRLAVALFAVASLPTADCKSVLDVYSSALDSLGDIAYGSMPGMPKEKPKEKPTEKSRKKKKEKEKPRRPRRGSVQPGESTLAFDEIWSHRDQIIPKNKCESYTPKNVAKDKYKVYGVNTPWAKIAILDMCGHRDLYTDNNIQSSELDEFIYHEALVHPAMVAFQHVHGSPARRVFAAGGGELSIAREALRWPTVEKVVTVDIDGVLVDTIREWIPAMPGNAHEDPRSEIRIGDAVAELNASASGSFDVFVKDLPDAFEMQAAKSFYSVEFYRMVKDKLVEGGFAVDSSGPCNIQTREDFTGNSYDLEGDMFLHLYGMLSAVFKHVDVMHFPMTKWFGDHHMYCVFVASDAADPVGRIPAEVVDKILPFPGAAQTGTAARAHERTGLGFYNGRMHALTFTKSQEASDALQEAAMHAMESEDTVLGQINMDVSKSAPGEDKAPGSVEDLLAAEEQDNAEDADSDEDPGEDEAPGSIEDLLAAEEEENAAEADSDEADSEYDDPEEALLHEAMQSSQEAENALDDAPPTHQEL